MSMGFVVQLACATVSAVSVRTSIRNYHTNTEGMNATVPGGQMHEEYKTGRTLSIVAGVASSVVAVASLVGAVAELKS